MLKKTPVKTPWSVAAPSWVVPGSVADNQRFLAPHFPEIGLYFLQAGPCLDYGPDDLPGHKDGLSHHVHLPLDLPWNRGAAAVFDLTLSLEAKIAHLDPWGYVLHPPTGPGGAALLAHFAGLWRDSGRDPAAILLENTEDAGPGDLWPAAADLGLSVCLDLGHMLAYGHERLLVLPGLFERLRMLHVYAPRDPVRDRDLRGGHKHRGLGLLDDAGREILRTLLSALSPGGTVVLEVFSPEELGDSWRALALAAGLPESAGPIESAGSAGPVGQAVSDTPVGPAVSAEGGRPGGPVGPLGPGGPARPANRDRETGRDRARP